MFALGTSDTQVAAVEQELYALGLDFVTEVAVQPQKMIKVMNAHSAQIRGDLEVSDQILREQKELDVSSKDF